MGFGFLMPQPKANALAQFVNSKAFFYPLEKRRLLKKSIDFLSSLY